MKKPQPPEQLLAEHHPDAIEARLDGERRHSYLSDAVLGAMDGAVSTLAIVTGVLGAGLSGMVAAVLGLAKLLADAFSMAVSNHQAILTRQALLDDARHLELRHIEQVPDGEREEIRQIFRRKGFHGELLENVVTTITADRDLWVDTMLREELGLQTEIPNATIAAAATFAAFVGVGIVPLLPFFLPGIDENRLFAASVSLAVLTFFLIGALRGLLAGRPPIGSGLHTLLVGSIAAGLAYGVGQLLT